jgi:adenine deaminase
MCIRDSFPAVINSDHKMIREIAETVAAGKVVGGHFAARINDHAIHGYAAAGVEDDHEGTTLEDAVTRIRQGMKVMLRYGSAWHDVAEGVRAITELGQDPRNFILCTDDSHSQTLVDEGHVNRAVNQAILNGVDPVSAIQMATINTAEHFRLTRDVGMIAPGRYADIIIIEDIDKIAPILVIGKGDVLYQDSQLRLPPPQFRYPDWILESINIPSHVDQGDFTLSVNPSGRSKVVANVIGVLENQAPTKRLKLEVTPNHGKIHPDIQRDIAKLALIERHHGTGKTQVGLVHGFGFTSMCAVASTVAHDSHHMVIVGTDETDMAIAANELIKIGGGQIVVQEGNVLAFVELPIAGIISNKEAETVSHEVSRLLDAFRECGCKINNPNMQLSLLALVVIPELRISDLGLVDVTNQRFIPVIES